MSLGKGPDGRFNDLLGGGSLRALKVRVVCYDGYKAEETPRAFLLGERRIEVVRATG